MRNVSDKLRQKNKTRILCSIAFFSENRAFYEIMWKFVLQPDRHRWEFSTAHTLCTPDT